jgi:hypothetical protein
VFKYIPQNLDRRDKLWTLSGLQLLPLSEQGTVNALKNFGFELSEVHEHNAIKFLDSNLITIVFRVVEKTSAHKLTGPIAMGNTLQTLYFCRALYQP